MLDWLFGKRKSKELPEYSLLRSMPTRGLPTELAEKERRETFSLRQDSLQRELLESPRRPADDKPLLTTLLGNEGSGVVTIRLPEREDRCLPVFSTSYRAADYKQTLLPHGPTARYLVSSPVQFIRMLRDLEALTIRSFAFDPCPRCTIFNSYYSCSVKAPGDVVTIWAIHKATEFARAELYFAYALESARAGRLEVARDVALETIGHVSLEDPNTHLLLGQVAVGLRDRVLLQEAKASLRLLNSEPWERKLDQSVRSGSPDF